MEFCYQACCIGNFLCCAHFRVDHILYLLCFRDVTAEFKRTDTLLGNVGQKDAFVHVINANGPILLQYHVSASCKVYSSFKPFLSLR